MPVKKSKRTELQRWLDQHSAGEIGEADLQDLRNTLAPISENYLRTLLRESGAQLAPMVAGVRQANLDVLESSLTALADEYEHGDAERRTAMRRLVITAKDHARWALRRRGKPAEKSASVEESAAEKEEMILWMITWLENPPLFRQWVRLRRTQIATPDTSL